jgi:hypothetical protein
VQGFAYAASKLMGDRACLAEAHRSGGALTSVCVRIGWCQPGENRPEMINTSGLPGAEKSTGPDTKRDLRWFRNMWLSNRDFVAVIERGLLSEGERIRRKRSVSEFQLMLLGFNDGERRV